MIRKVIDAQLNDGFALGQIFLAGFSQGGAMAIAYSSPYFRLIGWGDCIIGLSAFGSSYATKTQIRNSVFYGAVDNLILLFYRNGLNKAKIGY